MRPKPSATDDPARQTRLAAASACSCGSVSQSANVEQWPAPIRSLTLHLQRDEPTDPTQHSNWLPTTEPGKLFRLILRQYIPRPAILRGHYHPPGVTRIRLTVSNRPDSIPRREKPLHSGCPSISADALDEPNRRPDRHRAPPLPQIAPAGVTTIAISGTAPPPPPRRRGELHLLCIDLDGHTHPKMPQMARVCGDVRPGFARLARTVDVDTMIGIVQCNRRIRWGVVRCAHRAGTPGRPAVTRGSLRCRECRRRLRRQARGSWCPSPP